ncbi:hypothetical protein DFH06DRAFT_1130984 [Mycena polygramma]|nr:hypothetical protein DFH06DRAFT_1130984 [Mycena polygramma]
MSMMVQLRRSQRAESSTFPCFAREVFAMVKIQDRPNRWMCGIERLIGAAAKLPLIVGTVVGVTVVCSEAEDCADWISGQHHHEYSRLEYLVDDGSHESVLECFYELPMNEDRTGRKRRVRDYQLLDIRVGLAVAVVGEVNDQRDYRRLRIESIDQREDAGQQSVETRMTSPATGGRSARRDTSTLAGVIRKKQPDFSLPWYEIQGQTVLQYILVQFGGQTGIFLYTRVQQTSTIRQGTGFASVIAHSLRTKGQGTQLNSESSDRYTSCARLATRVVCGLSDLDASKKTEQGWTNGQATTDIEIRSEIVTKEKYPAIEQGLEWERGYPKEVHKQARTALESHSRGGEDDGKGSKQGERTEVKGRNEEERREKECKQLDTEGAGDE